MTPSPRANGHAALNLKDYATPVVAVAPPPAPQPEATLTLANPQPIVPALPVGDSWPGTPAYTEVLSLAPLPLSRRIGRYSIGTASYLLADLGESQQVSIYTSVMEIDSATQKSKNKRLVFKKAEAPDEYAAALAWIADMERGATDPDGDLAQRAAKAEASENEAWRLNDEMTTELDAAKQQIKELTEVLAPLRGFLNKAGA